MGKRVRSQLGLTLWLEYGCLALPQPLLQRVVCFTLQVYLKALLLRMRRTLDDDVFMPLYPKK